uniref:sulfotransferase family protein n=1 Tax=Chromohalobacter sp. 48-RD10 TaxID=2994063 RepID=UPI0024690DBE
MKFRGSYKLQYAHASDHRVTIGKWFRKRYKTLVHGLGDRWVAPISTDLSTCFVVGCGHSGTTLVAAKLGRHGDAHLIGRETHGYAPACGLRASRRSTQEWLSTLRANNKKLLIEKTPKHVHVIPRVRRVLPEARFLAMVRNPLDNCFSLYQRYGDLGFAIDRWNMDNAAIIDQV